MNGNLLKYIIRYQQMQLAIDVEMVYYCALTVCGTAYLEPSLAHWEDVNGKCISGTF